MLSSADMFDLGESRWKQTQNATPEELWAGAQIRALPKSPSQCPLLASCFGARHEGNESFSWDVDISLIMDSFLRSCSVWKASAEETGGCRCDQRPASRSELARSGVCRHRAGRWWGVHGCRKTNIDKEPVMCQALRQGQYPRSSCNPHGCVRELFLNSEAED